MTESIADRTYRAALQQWESGAHCAKPTRADFAHLDTAPDTVPEFATAEPVRLGGDAVPEPLDAQTRAAVDASLEQMRAGSGWRSTRGNGGGDAA